MRILFISAFYPPYEIGGWEQLVRDMNEELQARGHTTHVLTSTHGVGNEVCEAGVDRLLALESDLYYYKPHQFLMHKRRLRRNLAHVRATIMRFQPDVVFVHVMFNLSRGVPWLAEQLCPQRVVYYVANDWPYAADPHTAYWHDLGRNPLTRLAKGLIAPLPLRTIAQEQQRFKLRFERVLCVSRAVKRELEQNTNIQRKHLHVVYNGVETDLFVPPPPGVRSKNGHLTLLYAGSLVEHKGVHTAVEAMVRLQRSNSLNGTQLTIAGTGHPSYERRLQRLVAQAGLENAVQFIGRVPRQQMPAILQQHDVLIFPSTWEEPLARMIQEAMATGMVVVGTLTGGTGELLIEGKTGLTFAPDDAEALAQRIEELRDNVALRTALARQGCEKVLNEFSIERMIDGIEAHLAQVVAPAYERQPSAL